jgi:hypothetical protein
MKKIKQILPILAVLLSIQFQAVAENVEADTTKKKNKKERFTSAYPYENFGTKQKITLYATMENNNVIMAIENLSDDSANVRIKAFYDCLDKTMPKGILRQEMVRTVAVPPHTTVSYDNDKTLVMITCEKQILTWNITSWSVDKYPLVSEK